MSEKEFDIVNKARHYNVHPVFRYECIDYVKNMGFCEGNAFKYLYRHKDKEKPSQDIRKAIYYLLAMDSTVLMKYDSNIAMTLIDDFKEWEKKYSPVINGGIDYYESIVYKTMVALYTQPDREKILEYVKNLEKYADLLEKEGNK